MKTLSFNHSGKFKIVQFTDLHLQNGELEDEKTITLMEKILDKEKPDLAVLTGDTIRALHCIDPKKAFSLAVGPMENRRIPWAAVFGNHDDEGAVSKEDLMNLQKGYLHCYSRPGSKNVTGVGNYDIPIYQQDGSLSFILYFLDSGSIASGTIGGYDWIKRNQIEWYEHKSRNYSFLNKKPLPSLAFFHIPLPEFNDLWDYHVTYGNKFEPVGCPKVNSGLFSAMVERQDVKGIFVGHDHINDFCGDYFGIRLAYGRATGFNTYGKEGYPRGARIIELLDNTFRTWIRLEDGSVIENQIIHHPQGNSDENRYVEVQ
ncbi:metallophosphoesterase family protein [Neobacillus drentensis]|uniref:metallophosphoesterase family protein n=1 Tax=Neobacillus drentensis TaxID=220684 RepID=UPI002FFD9AF6